MDVEPENAAAKSQHEGKTYHFCSVDCKQKFEQDPKKFAQKETKAANR
jgi:YHS domain-containing protein